MFKSRLQEYCHRNSWGLPKYTITKGGPDHNPKFKATVVVNGVAYEVQGFHKSSKDAQNEAARVAFESLIDADRSSSDEDLAKWQIKSPRTEELSPNDLLPETGSQGDASNLVERNEAMASEMQLNYKSYLQEFVQGRRWSSPVYALVREGPAHAPRFSATVTVEGKSFRSPDFFGTVREAEHDAARIALASFHEEGTQEDKSLSFKNMLKDYSQKRSLHLPTYSTESFGASHLPTFRSTVEIDGKVYTGDSATTKKEAEANAAKIAWFALKERGSRTSSSSKLQLGTISNALVNLANNERNYKPEASSSDKTVAKGSLIVNNKSKPSLECKLQVTAGSGASTTNLVSDGQKPKSSLTCNNEAEESTIFTSGEEPAIGDVLDKDESHLGPEEESTISSQFAADICNYLNEQFVAGNSTTQGTQPASSTSERLLPAPTISSSKSASNLSRPKGSSILDAGTSTASKLQNHVVVFPRLLNMKLPLDGVKVQFSDAKWVAVTGTDSTHGAK
ncbi:double-stranded RNA-binding protein 1-like isoform X2 [Nymphaea colorata]|uniref:double-stranded RNA-binding protein 1-like isoform X2 n=1 Tax=Nymphaea colorata TaxID=210225 RepID=UPI00129E004E|nr:double-stranded RNA-binding protein 1-like isoform X2 [Nymphaea colorata]